MDAQGRKDAPKYDRFTIKGRGLVIETKKPRDAKRGELVLITYREYNTRHEPTNKLWTRWVRKRAGPWWK
jgi:hypothetical protein